LSKEFGWSPEKIERLTLQQLSHYLERLSEYREFIKPEDVELTQIRKALFGFFGVKERNDADIDKQTENFGLPKMKVSKEAMIAWEKAGRPNPNKFFAEYRKK